MTCGKSLPRGRAWAAVLVLLLILATRAISLTYQIDIHPDEYKFARSTDSLMNTILEPGSSFVEEKEYPEGSYYFHLPFHLAGVLLERLTGLEYNMAVCGRVSSVFYFCLAVLLGMKLLAKYMKAAAPAPLIFGLSMCFSLFFLEHSRYGTGDMISLFLIFLIIYLSAQAAGHGLSGKYMYPAWFLCGVLGAVKYPLLLFSLIPLSLFLYASCRGLKGKLAGTGLFLLLVLAGLLLWSPKALADPGYFLRVIEREMSAYVSEGKSFEAGGLINHITSMAVYTLFFSDFPLSSLVTAGLFISFARSKLKKRKNGEPMGGEEFLLWAVLPVLCTVFFIYKSFPEAPDIQNIYSVFWPVPALQQLCSWKDVGGRRLETEDNQCAGPADDGQRRGSGMGHVFGGQGPGEADGPDRGRSGRKLEQHRLPLPICNEPGQGAVQEPGNGGPGGLSGKAGRRPKHGSGHAGDNRGLRTRPGREVPSASNIPGRGEFELRRAQLSVVLF